MKLFRPNVYVLAVPADRGRATNHRRATSILQRALQRTRPTSPSRRTTCSSGSCSGPRPARRRRGPTRPRPRRSRRQVDEAWPGPSEHSSRSTRRSTSTRSRTPSARARTSRCSRCTPTSTRRAGKLDELPFDVLVVASAGYSERALLLIDAAAAADRRARRCSFSARARRTATCGGCSSRAPTTSSCSRRRRTRSAFAIRKILARRDTAAGEGRRAGAADRRARPEGRYREDADGDESRRCARQSWANRSRSSTSTCSSATSR